MQIGGLQKVSLIDYDDNISAVVFTQGCNFRCSFCHNPSLVEPTLFEETIPLDYVFNFLRRRVGKLTAVVITGGEPTLQLHLEDFIKEIKSMGYKVKLDTNGSNPKIISQLVSLVDYFAMDIKTSLEKYYNVCTPDMANTILESIKMLPPTSTEFRTTCVPGLVELSDIINISKLLPKTSKYFLQRFEPKLTLKNIANWTYTYEDVKAFQEKSEHPNTYIRGF